MLPERRGFTAKNETRPTNEREPRIQQMPDAVVANWLALTPAQLFKVDEADRQDIEIKFAMAG